MNRPLAIVHVGLPMDHPIVGEHRAALTARIEAHRRAMIAKGLRYEIAHVSPDAGLDGFAERLRAHPWDGVIVGAGVVGTPSLAHFMERIVDVARTDAPQAKILFIHGIEDVEPALVRWFGPLDR